MFVTADFFFFFGASDFTAPHRPHHRSTTPFAAKSQTAINRGGVRDGEGELVGGGEG